MTVITTECYHSSLFEYPSFGLQHCNGSMPPVAETIAGVERASDFGLRNAHQADARANRDWRGKAGEWP